jgi:hypothetical protein
MRRPALVLLALFTLASAVLSGSALPPPAMAQGSATIPANTAFDLGADPVPDPSGYAVTGYRMFINGSAVSLLTKAQAVVNGVVTFPVTAGVPVGTHKLTLSTQYRNTTTGAVAESGQSLPLTVTATTTTPPPPPPPAAPKAPWSPRIIKLLLGLVA